MFNKAFVNRVNGWYSVAHEATLCPPIEF
jgi:hypothetical protein